jgi:hypothetical protein
MKLKRPRKRLYILNLDCADPIKEESKLKAFHKDINGAGGVTWRDFNSNYEVGVIKRFQQDRVVA